jgi:pSer/pThr/pTyr-binding forkhead associated (FHA) protein
MKKIYSISLEEEIVRELDEYCMKTGSNRSFVISELIINNLSDKKGIDIRPIDYVNKNKTNIIDNIYLGLANEALFKKAKYNIALLEDTIVLPTINNRISLEVKFLHREIKIELKLNSSAQKYTNLFEALYSEHKNMLLSIGFERFDNKRSWLLSYSLSVPNIKEENFTKDEYSIIIIDKIISFFEIFVLKTDQIVNIEDFKNYKATKQIHLNETDGYENPYLKVISGKKPGEIFIIDKDEINIGRKDEINAIYPDVDLTLQEYNENNPFVSRNHAIINKKNNHFYICDLNSSNKTYINQKQIVCSKNKKSRMYEIKDRDQIIIGNIIMEFYEVVLNCK